MAYHNIERNKNKIIQPAAVKYTCTCGFSRIYQPQSDVVNILHAQHASTCPKCGNTMNGEQLPFGKHHAFTFSDGMPDEKTLLSSFKWGLPKKN